MELRHPTFRTEECRERGVMPDTEAVEDPAISLRLDVNVPDPFSGYTRRFHLDITIRTMAFAHSAHAPFPSRLVKRRGQGFTSRHTETDTFSSCTRR